MSVTAVSYDLERIESAIGAVRGRFPEIERIRYSVGEDWTNDPALFVRVLLKDSPDTRDILHNEAGRLKVVNLANRIAEALWGELPAGDLFPHITFRSVAEQEQLHDPQWD